VPKSPLLLIPAVAALTALALAGCAPTTPADGAPGVVQVVASTNVYGDIAATIGGDAVAVTSIIDNPDQDPHEYEASARTQLALSKAQLVIENGGGYDDFVGTMLSAAGNDGAVVLDAVEISGYDASVGGFNEHVWYDYPTVGKVVDAIVEQLSAIDPDAAGEFEANAAPLRDGLAALEAKEAEIATAHGGAGVIITEPVPLYALTAAGLDNLTPPAFSEAVEEDTDAPAEVVQQVLGALDDGSAALVVFNEQTGGPQTDAVLAAAKQAGVPTVGVTETLPDGVDYIAWQTDVLDRIDQALGG